MRRSAAAAVDCATKDPAPAFAPTELSRSVVPIPPASRLVAFDMTSLRHLRDCRKIAVLAPARLRHDLAALDADRTRRLTALAELQEALRQLPALMPLQDGAPTIDGRSKMFELLGVDVCGGQYA